MSAQTSFQVSGGSTGIYAGELVFSAGNGCRYAGSAVANGKKENRKRLLFCWRDKAMNKAVKEFVRTKSRYGDCGCGFQPGRAIRALASVGRRVAAATRC